MAEPLLSVENLKTYFFIGSAISRAVDGVSFTVARGETLGLVGESGCGKTVSSLSIMRLVPSPPGRIIGGRILFDGRDLLTLRDEDMRRVRGREIGMVFQEPMTSLNPVYTIGYQIAEVLLTHTGITHSEAYKRAEELLSRVKMPAPAKQLACYPHELSGGLRQRVMIAMAVACQPKLLIADEPTTALDVTIQAQILELFQELKATLGMSMLLVTHNLAVVAEVADAIAVMYAGYIVEYAETRNLFAEPIHPYTVGLLTAVPTIARKSERLEAIPGNVPDPADKPPGCPFHPRCYLRRKLGTRVCDEQVPDITQCGPRHWVRCWNAPREHGK